MNTRIYVRFENTLVIAIMAITTSLGPDTSRADERSERVLDHYDELKADFQPTRFTYLNINLLDGKESPPVVGSFHQDSGIVETGNEVHGYNSKYLFKIVRASEDTPWEIRELSPFGSDVRIPSEIIFARGMPLNNLRINHVPLDVAFDHPLVKVGPWSDDGNGLISVEVTFSDPQAVFGDGLQFRLAKGEVFFRPDEYGWFPTELVAYWPGGEKATFSNENFVPAGDHLLAASSTMTMVKPPSETPIAKGETKYVWSFDEPNPEVFYLSHYGIAEPAFADAGGIRIWYLVVGAAVLAAIFTVTKRLTTRTT